MTIPHGLLFVQLRPCTEHVRTRQAPHCCHSWGGAYEIIRQIRGGMVLLQHLDRGNIGLATYDDIIWGRLRG